MKARDCYTKNFISLTLQSTIRDCLEAFIQNRIDIACVTDAKGCLLGIVSKYTIYRELLSGQSLDAPIGPIIRRQVVCCHENDRLEDAKDILLKNNVGHCVVLNNDNRVIGVMGKADITRGLLLQTELLLGQTRSLVEQLQDAVISVDPQYQIVTYNREAEELFGYPPDKVLGQHIKIIFPELYEDFFSTLEKGERLEQRRIRFGNVTVIGSFVPILNWGNITGAVAVLKDITSYEKIAKELETTKKLERTLDSALQISYDGVMITDEHGTITKVNPAFLDFYQLEDHEAVGKPAAHVTPELPIQDILDRKRRVEGEIIEIRGKKCIVTIQPMIRNKKCEGTITKFIFYKLDQWKDIFRRLEQLESELSYYRGELNRITHQNTFDRIISINGKMEKIKKEAYLASKGTSTVLITGESGTGKELFAEAIHEESGRAGNFVKVNCAAIPAELLESEFFGYAEGAFTGARKGGKPGKFELADQGTLFLDEIGDMPLALQAKLLRVLQEQKFERVGDTKTRKVDVRIIAATNKDLRQMVRQGTFREDLYYRINVIHVNIPPLRERKDDIPLLAEHLIKKLNQKMKKQVIGITPQTLERLQWHDWPGNVRELENVLERAMHLAEGVWIEPHHLPEELQRNPFTPSPNASLEANLSRLAPTGEPPAEKEPFPAMPLDNSQNLLAYVEKQTILQTLQESGGNRSLAAQRLGISRATLYQKMKKYNIEWEIRFSSGNKK